MSTPLNQPITIELTKAEEIAALASLALTFLDRALARYEQAHEAAIDPAEQAYWKAESDKLRAGLVAAGKLQS